MTISERITQARRDRRARRLDRTAPSALMAARGAHEEAVLALSILDQLTFVGGRDRARQSS